MLSENTDILLDNSDNSSIGMLEGYLFFYL
jgi:hypothetical protein